MSTRHRINGFGGFTSPDPAENASDEFADWCDENDADAHDLHAWERWVDEMDEARIDAEQAR